MTTATLTIHERDELAGCEQIIERGLRTFVEVGQALLTIRDDRLYRVEHTTFEDYCESRWQISRPQAYRFIDAAATVAVVSPNGDTTPCPTSEGVARELTPLRNDPDAQRAAWSQTIDLHGAQPTAAQTREVVDVVRDLPPQQRSVDHVAQALRAKPQPDMRFMHVNEAARNLRELPDPAALWLPDDDGNQRRLEDSIRFLAEWAPRMLGAWQQRTRGGTA